MFRDMFIEMMEDLMKNTVVKKIILLTVLFFTLGASPGLAAMFDATITSPGVK